MKIKVEKWIFDDTCSYKVKSIKKCCDEILNSNLVDLVYDYDNEDDTDYSVKLIDRRHEYDGYDKDYYDYTVYENIYYCPFCGEKIEIEIVSVINKNKEYCELKNQRNSLYDKCNKTDSIRERDFLREQIRELDNKIDEFHINGDLKGEIFVKKYIFEKDYYNRFYGTYYKEGETADIVSGEVRKDGYYIFSVESEEFHKYGRELTENKSVKGYMASNFFDLGGYEVTDKIANIIEKYGVDLYVPQRNDEINDKENVDPTAIQIWETDINYLKQSDILFLYYDGEDAGVMSELGYFASMLENTSKKGLIVGIYTDCRQFGDGDGHHYINLFSKGGIEKHGVLICSNKWNEIEETIKKAIDEFKLNN